MTDVGARPAVAAKPPAGKREAPVAAAQVAAVRAFNRFYTRRIGLLHEGLLHSPFSLTEARVLYELAGRDGLTATALCRGLGLDAGYLSRMLKTFRNRGLVSRSPSARDGREAILALTPAGRAAFAPLDAASRAEVGAFLAPLPTAERTRLLDAMAEVRRLLDGETGSGATGEPRPAAPVRLRRPRPGDLGWMVHRQAALYHQEYGWDGSFEALVAEIAASFVSSFDPSGERAWIAERGGDIVGGVLVTRKSDTVAKLRMLYVEPSARGHGVGRRLVGACIRFARSRGYRTLTLWTNDILISARRIYEAAGFTLVAEEPHHAFGHDLVGQTWEKAL